MNGLGIIAEALLRVEHKLDALLTFIGVKPIPMHFIGQKCPSCLYNIDYLIDVEHQLVKRRCNCKTGKIPSTISLLPVGDDNAKASRSGSTPERIGDPESAKSRALDRSGRQAGRAGSRNVQR